MFLKTLLVYYFNNKVFEFWSYIKPHFHLFSWLLLSIIIASKLNFYIKIIAKVIISFITVFILSIILLWNNLTSAIEINKVFINLDEIIREDKLYKLITKIILYINKR